MAKKQSLLDKLNSGMNSVVTNMISEDDNNSGEKKDYNEGFYKPNAKDHSVNVKIRFLPTLTDNGTRITIFEKEWKHFMKIGGVFKVFPCMTAVESNSCPICNHNKKIFSAEKKDQMKKEGRFRAKKWIANILIVDDPVNPELNGTIMRYRLGEKLYSKIMSELKDDPDLLRPDNGYDFLLKVENADNMNFERGIFPNYDASRFARKATAIAETEEEIIEIIDGLNDFSDIAKDYNIDVDVLEKNYYDYIEEATGQKNTSTEKTEINRTVKKEEEDTSDVDEMLDEMKEDEDTSNDPSEILDNDADDEDVNIDDFISGLNED